jgi:outer membrane protein assembly factor BamD (BamD/ComL family)
MDEGDRAFAGAHYDDAAGAYENYLRVAPSGLARDHVLYQLGLTYALRAAPTDWQRAMAMFKQLIEEYPESPLKGPANLIVSLRTEVDQLSTDAKQRDQRIKQLTTELDRLRKIDTDRRKRP